MHCVKSVHIQKFFGLFFLAYRLNTEYLSAFSPNAGKYGPEKLQILRVSPVISRPSSILHNWIQNNENIELKQKIGVKCVQKDLGESKH